MSREVIVRPEHYCGPHCARCDTHFTAETDMCDGCGSWFCPWCIQMDIHQCSNWMGATYTAVEQDGAK